MAKPDPYAFWFNRDQIAASQATKPPPVDADAPPSPQKLAPGARVYVDVMWNLLPESVRRSMPEPAIPAPGDIIYRDVSVWGIRFYIRVDPWGCFYTYPSVGGPFQSVDQTLDAIDSYLVRHRDENMLKGLSPVDCAVQQALYWPDGTRKKHLRSQPIDKRRDSNLQMAEALLDKYNDDHNLSWDHAYRLKDVVCYQIFNEGGEVYGHINFTATTRATGCIDKLFFAEFQHRTGLSILLASICILEPTDNGYCHGCKNRRSDDMKHPADCTCYVAGHTRYAFARFGSPRYPQHFDDEDTEAELETAKARLRWLLMDVGYVSHQGETPAMEDQGDGQREAKRAKHQALRDLGETLAFLRDLGEPMAKEGAGVGDT